jgi:hypothetical protein
MTPFLGLLLILVTTFIGVRFFGRSTVLKTPLFSGLIVSGVPYILIGVILGPRIFNFLNPDVIIHLKPLISMAIGWVGLLFGLQLRWRNIRRFPGNYVLFTSVQSMVSFVIIFFGMGAILHFIGHPSLRNRPEALLILAALGSMTAPISIGRIIIEKKVKGRLAHLLQFVSSLDSFWGIVIAGLTMAIYHSPALRWISGQWQWILLSIILSVVIGIIFRFLFSTRFGQEETFLIVLGLIIFTSGIGFYLRLSPIFINMIVGITMAQFHRESDKVMRVLHLAEKPTYVFLLVFAGASWNFHFGEEILLIVTFIAVRFLGKYAGGWISASRIDCAFPIPRNVGKALLSFGGISLALAFNFQLFYGGFMGDFLMSTTILAILFFDEYTAISIRQILQRQGELA